MRRRPCPNWVTHFLWLDWLGYCPWWHLSTDGPFVDERLVDQVSHETLDALRKAEHLD